MNKSKIYHLLGILLIFFIVIGSVSNSFIVPSALEDNEQIEEETEEAEETEEDEHTHEFGDWVVVEEATTENEGVKERYCECGEKETETIPVLEVEEENEETEESTEETEETTEEPESDDTQEIHEHEFGDWIVEKMATTEEEGIEKRTCSCGEVEERSIPKIETIETPVLEVGIKSRMNNKMLASTNQTTKVYINATFNGFTGSATFNATNSDGEVVATKTVSESGTFTLKVPTGRYAEISCILNGEDLRRVKSTFSTIAGNFTNDSYSLVGTFTYESACSHPSVRPRILKPATYAEKGLTENICEVCGRSVGVVETDKLACTHDRTTRTVIEEPTEFTTGLAEIKCNLCRARVNTEVIPKKEHVHDFVERTVPATCKAEGKKIKICNGCGENIVLEVLPKIDHTYDAGTEAVAATCNATGRKVYTCTVCGQQKSETIPMLGHNYELVRTIPATCTEKGSKEYVCTRCNDVKTTVIAKTAHDWSGEYVVTKEPTCSETGIKELYCTSCNESISQIEVPKLAHTYIWEVTKEPTILAEGSKAYKCSACGYVANTVAIPKLECKHEGERIYEQTQAPTCADRTHYKVTCKLCDKVIDEDYQNPGEVINTDAHTSWTTATLKEASYTEPGIKRTTCNTCGYYYDEEIPQLTCLHATKKVSNIDDKLYWTCKTCGKILSDASESDCVHSYYGVDYVEVEKATSTTWGKVESRCKNCKALIKTENVHPYSEYHVTDQNGKDVTLYGWYDDEYAQRILQLTNEYRQENGLNTLSYNTTCQDASNLRALESIVYWAHTRPNGTRWNTITENWKYGGENLAEGQQTPELAMTGWKKSESHNKNLLYGIKSGETPFKAVSISVFHRYTFDGANPYVPRERITWVQNFTFYQY